MIGRLAEVVIDCDDPRALARFYRELIGGEIVADDPDWVELMPPIEGGRPLVSFQQVADYRRPEWPGQDVPQQIHLDVRVDDLDAGEAAVLAIGATRTGSETPSFRVYLDPAGHPFCLIDPKD